MDDDTVVHPDTLTELLKFADKQDQFGFLSSDVRWTDGHRALMNQPAPMNRLKVIPEDQVEPVQLQNATFVSLLVKREVVKKIGLPITEFFIWGDDIEYTERAGRVAPGYFVPSAKVTHKMAEMWVVVYLMIMKTEHHVTFILTEIKDIMQKRDFYRRNRAYYVCGLNISKLSFRIQNESKKSLISLKRISGW